MTMINLRGVQKLYGGRPILNGITWTIEEGARIGVVGPNGAGKSTLLRIVAGIEDFQAGEVTKRRGLRVAYLQQHVPGDARTPIEWVVAAREDLAELEGELAAVEAQLAEPEVYGDMKRMSRVLAQQERLLERYEELGGPGLEGEARARLLALGFAEEDLRLPTQVLSGGQRKLAALAACLTSRPSLLLLDEPETHLDLAGRHRIEALVREFEGAVVLIAHDRYLLDETVSEIVELERGQITSWPGNYSAYAVARELALQRQQELYAAQQKEIARLEEAIKRFKLWASLVPNERHIKQARVKQRQIDQMDKVNRPVLERRTMGLQLRSGSRGGQKVLGLTNAGVAFDGDPVLLDVNLTVWRGERVGIVGVNGAGKSVLGRLLAGTLALDEGERWIGPSIKLGIFTQGHETLPPDATPLELVRAAKQGYEDVAVAILGRFLFSYQQVRQPVRTLSGGERSRLQLLLLMLSGCNCLILDEPTNHLDIESAEVLEQALEQFDGTVIVISHDRYFLDRIVDRVVEVRDGEALPFDGGYSAWSERR